jgi:hypothetical protein
MPSSPTCRSRASWCSGARSSGAGQTQLDRRIVPTCTNISGRGRYRTADRWCVNPGRAVYGVAGGAIASSNAQVSGSFVSTVSTECRAVFARLGTLLAQRGLSFQRFGGERKAFSAAAHEFPLRVRIGEKLSPGGRCGSSRVGGRDRAVSSQLVQMHKAPPAITARGRSCKRLTAAAPGSFGSLARATSRHGGRRLAHQRGNRR